jgi:UDP-N-acetyl-D-galactosamine dehydrogenase
MVSSHESVEEYGIPLTALENISNVDGLVLAVSHQAYIKMGVQELLKLLRSQEGSVVVDVKACLDPKTLPASVRYWRL